MLLKGWIEINDKCECQNQLFVDGNYLLNKIRLYFQQDGAPSHIYPAWQWLDNELDCIGH